MTIKCPTKGGQDPSVETRYNFLSDNSPKDKIWDTNRARTDTATNHLANTDLGRHSERMSTCNYSLLMAETTDQTTGELKYKLKQASNCNCRTCPICTWLRARVWQKRLTQGIPLMLEANPNIRFLFLTLTIPNCPVNELRTAINLLSDSFTKLIQRKALQPFLRGYFRVIEVTKSDSPSGNAHPHIHAILAVAPGYFSTYYLTQAKWQELWADCTGITNAIIDIRRVKAPKGSDNPYLSLAKEVCKVAQYTSKSGKSEHYNTSKDILSDRDWFIEYSKQIACTKAITKGGLFKQYLKDKEVTGEEILEAVNEADKSDVDNILIRFKWHSDYKKYATEKASSPFN
jgi:hypothetical protein